MALINVWFYEPNANDKWLNSVVNRYDPPYSHCDVQFDHDKMASSVFQYESVYWKKRQFRRPGYKKITVSVGKEPCARAYDMCETRAKEKYGFDAINMVLLPAAKWLGFERDKKTFCSKHCTEILQAAQLRAVEGAVPSHMTPTSLYNLLASSTVIHADSSRLAGLRIEVPARQGRERF